MYCPKCGKQQVSDDMRYCAGCGLSLENSAQLLATGSVLKAVETSPRKEQLSPRTKGILQGVALVPASIGLWLVFDIIYESLGAGMIGGLYAMGTLILLVGLLRILYALFHEEGSARQRTESALPSARPHEVAGQDAVLSLSTSELATGEMVQPQSITEKTTRHLGAPR